MHGNTRTVLHAAGLALACGLATLLVIGLPTAVIPNRWFRRMTPTRPQDYVFLGVTALLAAAIGGTYARPSRCPLQEGKTTTGGLLAFLAIGCPICNKIVVLLLGVSGALTYFAPIQPVLGLGSIVLLGGSLWMRRRAFRSAPLPVPHGVTKIVQ